MYTKPIAVRSVLSPNYLTYCLEKEYNIGEWLACVYLLKGLNDTYQVRTTSGLYILRLYRTEVRESDVDYELSVLVQLADILGGSKVSTGVSKPIYKQDNGLYSAINAPEGQRMAVLFEYVSGEEKMLQDAESCFAFGKSAAQLHAAMDRITVERPANRYQLDTTCLIDESLGRIVQYIGEAHPHTSFLRKYGAALKAGIEHAAEQGLGWGMCHGDMHGNNNAFLVGDHYVHYDFEWTSPGWRAYDLAQVKARKRQPAEEKRQELWDALMAGYRTVRSFSKHEELSVDLFIAVRRLWVMSLDVAFIPSDAGVLDYGDDWLNAYIDEFRTRISTIRSELD
ncbi:Ser/Thr protein kinase RdoA (MazF antagonist) [Paenibacillus cellulosilyticus]|uniref:Ser/Thr protein kinase RdoA (MazF antagonist) n=1 Tax=Paenibacillus cellulosilyticus TaxID=375489 RepID=A0A2V2Z073_9BACL|nr:phosphotransferase [Paenibacillus cellulosilyticus]PWW08668.1 Ser/Thr protein kinase RdoA (MazF antagonist) [Paenibacillus cellulosilyticus]QKS48234.1 phosphotransferase [Paenibacillus cellulosilyticus]